MAKRDYGQLKEAQYHFTRVFLGRQNTLEHSHPLTLAALREVLITGCALGASETLTTSNEAINHGLEPLLGSIQDGADTTPEKAIAIGLVQSSTIGVSSIWSGLDNADSHSTTEGRVEACSRAIMAIQEERLGRFHPEVIKTLLWLLMLHLDFSSHTSGTRDKEYEARLFEAVTKRLQDPSLLKERRFESLQLRQTVAGFYDEYGFKNAAEAIRKEINVQEAEAAFELDSKRAAETTEMYIRALD